VTEVADQRRDVVRIAIDVIGFRARRVIALAVSPVVEENASVFLGQMFDITGRAP
jgi:hypothetical protein